MVGVLSDPRQLTKAFRAKQPREPWSGVSQEHDGKVNIFESLNRRKAASQGDRLVLIARCHELGQTYRNRYD